MLPKSAPLLLAFASAVSATIFTTSPVGSTTFPAGQPATITWEDDGKPPTLQEFGAAKISIYVGNARQQTPIQLITGSVDVGTTNTFQFTPEASIGPNSGEYFIRYESLALKDPGAPEFPALAFSAKFSLSGMSGEFNATVQAQIDGQTTAPLAGQSTTAKPSATGATTTTKAATGSGTGAGASATNSAVGIKAGWVGALLGIVASVVML